MVQQSSASSDGADADPIEEVSPEKQRELELAVKSAMERRREELQREAVRRELAYDEISL